MWNYLSGVKYEVENEKDLGDSEIESDLEEDIVFGKPPNPPSGPRHFHLGYCFLIWASSLKIWVAQLAIMRKKLILDPAFYICLLIVFDSIFYLWSSYPLTDEHPGRNFSHLVLS